MTIPLVSRRKDRKGTVGRMTIHRPNKRRKTKGTVGKMTFRTFPLKVSARKSGVSANTIQRAPTATENVGRKTRNRVGLNSCGEVYESRVSTLSNTPGTGAIGIHKTVLYGLMKFREPGNSNLPSTAGIFGLCWLGTCHPLQRLALSRRA